MEDGAILDLYFARDERAIGETDAKYGKKLGGLSFRITQDFREAEECVNDTYLAAWNAIPPARPVYLSAYLCKIVRNISYDVAVKKRAQKRNAVLCPLDGELLEILPDNKGVDADAEELARCIGQFLKNSDKTSRILFVRRYFYADTMQSLARLAGMSVNAVTVKLSRMRKKLRAYLSEEGYEV